MVAAHAAAQGDGLLEALLNGIGPVQGATQNGSGAGSLLHRDRVNEVEDFGAEAAYGALRENQHIHVRVLRAWLCASAITSKDSYFGRGPGRSTILPLDDDRLRCATRVWLATDDAYKAAGQALAEKQGGYEAVQRGPESRG